MNSEYIKVFKAFTDENRVRVLEILCEGEECACVLLDDLKISQPTLSHHMKILCESGIVRSRRKGKWNYYSINEDGCEYASQLLENIVKKHEKDLRRSCRDFSAGDRLSSTSSGRAAGYWAARGAWCRQRPDMSQWSAAVAVAEENSREEQNAD